MNTSVLGVYICQSDTPLPVIALCGTNGHKSGQLAALIKTALVKRAQCAPVTNQPAGGEWADLSLVPGCAPPLPPEGFGRSSSGSADADASRSHGVRSVCGDETPPRRGLQLQRLWEWAEQSGE